MKILNFTIDNSEQTRVYLDTEITIKIDNSELGEDLVLYANRCSELLPNYTRFLYQDSSQVLKPNSPSRVLGFIENEEGMTTDKVIMSKEEFGTALCDNMLSKINDFINNGGIA